MRLFKKILKTLFPTIRWQFNNLIGGTMKFTSALLAAVLVTVLPCAFAEDLSITVPLIIDPAGSFASGVVNAIHNETGTFTDTFNFTPAVGDSFAGASLTMPQNIDFTSASLNGHSLFLSPDNTFRPGLLPPTSMIGDLIMTVSGIAGNNASYIASVNVTLIPEPATYGMLLGGLAVLGAITKRRKQGGNQGSAACIGSALA
jgi:hypothetical protein